MDVGLWVYGGVHYIGGYSTGGYSIGGIYAGGVYRWRTTIGCMHMDIHIRRVYINDIRCLHIHDNVL